MSHEIVARENQSLSFHDINILAESVSKSGLFGMKTKEQALALMTIAQAEGRHPALAARDYHIIQGKPCLKADTMLSRFQESGGTVEWLEYSDNMAKATFTHPKGGSVTIDWDAARAKKAGLSGKDVYVAYSRAMYRARVISEGVRTLYPSCISGFYSEEEVRELKEVKGTDSAGRLNKILSEKITEEPIKSIEGFVEEKKTLDCSFDIENMRGASNIEELRRRFKSAIDLARSMNDIEAENMLTAVKDEVKTRLLSSKLNEEEKDTEEVKAIEKEFFGDNQ